MKRSDILLAGQYASLPKSILIDPNRTPAEKLVLMELIDRLGENDTTWPSVSTIGEDTGLSVNGVRKALARLKKSGLITMVGSKKCSSIWVIGAPLSSAVQPETAPQSRADQAQTPPQSGAAVKSDPEQPRHSVAQTALLCGADRATECSPSELLKGTTEGTTEVAALRCAQGADAPAADAASGRCASGPIAALSGSGAAVETGLHTQPATQKQEGTKSGLKTGKKKAPPLTQLNIAKIIASFESITAYLLYGMAGVDEPDPVKQVLLPPSQLNWRQFIVTREFSEAALGVDKWNASHFGAFFWFRVSMWRNERGIAMSLPTWGRVFGNIQSAMKQMTKWQLFNYIITLTLHFDLLCCMAGRIAEHMTLDEQVLSHSSFRNYASYYLTLKEAQQIELYAKHQDGIDIRKSRYAKSA